MKEHLCPTCGQSYGCPRGEPGCGSPRVYDCHCCYQRRYRKELRALAIAVAMRFNDEQSCFGDVSYAN